MLTEPLCKALEGVGLRGTARHQSDQLDRRDLADPPFNGRMTTLVDTKQPERANCYAQRLRQAKLLKANQPGRL